MQLTKNQKILHTIFRILVFLSFGAAVCEFFLFISLGIAAESSAYSYSSTLAIAKGICDVYYVLLILGVLSVVFSLICCKCTEVAATVTRTIFLVLAAGLNFTSFPAYEVIRKFADAYILGDYNSMIREYRYADSDAFETALAFIVLFTMVSISIYFVLSITSIVALAKKPQVYNNAYNQYYQQLYGRGNYNMNNRWNNGNPNMNNQWNNGNTNMNNQWNNGNPNMNNRWNNGAPNMNSQWNNGTPNMNNQWNNGNPNMNNQWNNTAGQVNPPENNNKSGVVLEKEVNTQFDENGVKQGNDGRKILCYDTMTGQPIYADENPQENVQTAGQEVNQEHPAAAGQEIQQPQEAVQESHENKDTDIL